MLDPRGHCCQTEAPSDRKSWSANAVAGGLAAAACRCVVAPFDVLKIRFQLQQAPVGLFGVVGKAAHFVKPGSGYYTSLWQATRAIVGEEGLQALWRLVQSKFCHCTGGRPPALLVLTTPTVTL